MTDIRFTEDKRTYRSRGCLFSAPGVYAAEDDKARQLLADFPHWFEAVKDTKQQPASPTPKHPNAPEGGQKGSDAVEPTKPLSKMNKDELGVYAADIGLDVTDEMDTNKKLKEAIEVYQEDNK